MKLQEIKGDERDDGLKIEVKKNPPSNITITGKATIAEQEIDWYLHSVHGRNASISVYWPDDEIIEDLDGIIRMTETFIRKVIEIHHFDMISLGEEMDWEGDWPQVRAHFENVQIDGWEVVIPDKKHQWVAFKPHEDPDDDPGYNDPDYRPRKRSWRDDPDFDFESLRDY